MCFLCHCVFVASSLLLHKTPMGQNLGASECCENHWVAFVLWMNEYIHKRDVKLTNKSLHLLWKRNNLKGTTYLNILREDHYYGASWFVFSNFLGWFGLCFFMGTYMRHLLEAFFKIRYSNISYIASYFLSALFVYFIISQSKVLRK